MLVAPVHFCVPLLDMVVQEEQLLLGQGALKMVMSELCSPRFRFHGSGVRPGTGFGKLYGDVISALGQCFSALASLGSA